MRVLPPSKKQNPGACRLFPNDPDLDRGLDIGVKSYRHVKDTQLLDRTVQLDAVAIDLKALLGERHTEAQVRESTAVARVNGWVSGHGKKDEILSEAKALGLSRAARQELTRALGRRAPALVESEG